MSLEDLNRNLYGYGSEDLKRRAQAPQEFDPLKNKNITASPFDVEQKWGKADKGMTAGQKKILKIIFGSLAGVLLLIGAYALWQWYKKEAFHQDRVEVSFEGPSEADSTQAVQYLIHYRNNNSVTLKNATLVVDYSENFQPIDNVNLKYLSTTASKFFIGDIKPRANETVTFKGVFYAPKDFPVYLHATLQYTPGNGSAQLENKNQLAVQITNAPVVLDLTLPETVSDGNSVEYVIDYKNLDTRPLKDAQLRVEYPDGFDFADSTPRPSENNSVWYLGALEPNQGGQVRIRGIISGTSGQEKTLKVTLGHLASDNQFSIFNQREKSSKMIAPLLSISQVLDGKKENIAQAGETLKYIIKYKNTGNLGLRNVIITEELKSAVLDLTQLKLDSGAFDSSKGIITWKASDIPVLANVPPQGSGEVHFTVPVKNLIPLTEANSKNFTIDSVAKIDSPDIPTPLGQNKIINSNLLSLKLGSKVILDSSGFFNDALLPNSGPLPMEIGKETTFTLHWGVTNVSNDLSEAKVTAALPTGARWLGKVLPENENLVYDPRTNALVWNLGKVVAGAGITSSQRAVAFQVGLTPQPSQAGTPLPLLGAASFTAKDDYTLQDIKVGNQPLDTQLRWDTKMDSSQYTVKKD